MDGLEKFNAVQTLQEVVIQGVKKAPAELAKTATHLLPLAIQGINLAAKIVNHQIQNNSLKNSADYLLTNAALDYYRANKDVLSFTDYLALDNLTKNYYKGLNLMAWWEKGDFLKLNRAVINSTLPDALKVQLVQLGIEDTQEGFAGIMGEGANVGLFISGIGLVPQVGLGPKGSMLKFRTLPQVPGTVSPAIQNELTPTLNRIQNGIKFPHRNDGSIFRNTEGILPQQPSGYYHEYVHPTPGVRGPGARRIVVGKSGDTWFTPDHYKSFIRIK